MKSKSIFILSFVIIMFCWQQTNAQIQFKFSDCLNKWSSFIDASNGIKVAAAYIKNDAGDQWLVLFMDTTDNNIKFNYTVYGGNSSFTKTMTVTAHGVSPITDANYSLG